MCFLKLRRSTVSGFTILELTTVILIIAILVTMLVGITTSMYARAEKSKCMANLRNLYYGASCHVMDQGYWPQIDPGLMQGESTEYARLWIQALSPYGLTQQNWICASQHRTLGSPDLTLKESMRLDYNGTPFDTQPYTPFRWGKQPWFVEHAAVHDGGPLLIYANGQVVPLSDAVRRQAPGK